MGHDDNRHVLTEFHQGLADEMLAADVQLACWLGKDEEFGSLHESSGQAKALLLSSAEVST